MYRDESVAGARYGVSQPKSCTDEEPVDWSIPKWEPNYTGILGPTRLDIPDILQRTPERETLILELGERAAHSFILGSHDVRGEAEFYQANGFYSNE